jgi:hypothetical protein
VHRLQTPIKWAFWAGCSPERFFTDLSEPLGDNKKYLKNQAVAPKFLGRLLGFFAVCSVAISPPRR